MLELGKLYTSPIDNFIYSSLDDARDGEDMLEMGMINANTPILILSQPFCEEDTNFQFYEVLADNIRGWIWNLPSQGRFSEVA